MIVYSWSSILDIFKVQLNRQCLLNSIGRPFHRVETAKWTMCRIVNSFTTICPLPCRATPPLGYSVGKVALRFSRKPSCTSKQHRAHEPSAQSLLTRMLPGNHARDHTYSASSLHRSMRRPLGGVSSCCRLPHRDNSGGFGLRRCFP